MCATAWPLVRGGRTSGRTSPRRGQRAPTRQDWARFIKAMLDERYPQAVKVRLVMDNLNTHDIASLYETFAPAEARRLAERLEIHYTPKTRQLAEHRRDRIERP